MPDELWVEVCDIVQKAVIKTTPKKKKHKRQKWLSEEALQRVEKTTEWERLEISSRKLEIPREYFTQRQAL